MARSKKIIHFKVVMVRINTFVHLFLSFMQAEKSHVILIQDELLDQQYWATFIDIVLYEV